MPKANTEGSALPFGLKCIALFGGTFIIGVLLIDRLEDIPSDTERCVSRTMELLPVVHERYRSSDSPRIHAHLEITAISICSGHQT